MKARNLILGLALMSFSICACTKDSTTPESIPCTSLTKKEILVKYTWQVDEVYNNISGVNKHYIKGGENTVGANYDVSRFTFKTDGTGTYTDSSPGTGYTFSTTWQFTTPNERNMKIIVASPTPLIFDWSLVEITDKAISAADAGVYDGQTFLIASRYTPVL